MLFVRIAYNAPDSGEARAQYFPAHKAHLETGGALVIQSGPLFATADDARVGALMIFDAPSLAEVEAFSARDPFIVHGIYDDVRILRFDKTIG
jgi:uncharacterized protein YciI